MSIDLAKKRALYRFNRKSQCVAIEIRNLPLLYYFALMFQIDFPVLTSLIWLNSLTIPIFFNSF
jgi:hypothetical protein